VVVKVANDVFIYGYIFVLNFIVSILLNTRFEYFYTKHTICELLAAIFNSVMT